MIIIAVIVIVFSCIEQEIFVIVPGAEGIGNEFFLRNLPVSFSFPIMGFQNDPGTGRYDSQKSFFFIL